jgi:hypothetical protein
MFDTKTAERDLRDYTERGPDPSTRQLVDALRAGGVDGRTLLDVGGGIGAIQLELLAAGLASATDVDASAAYLEVARREATKRGFGDRVTYRRGDFVEESVDVGPADLVTLDRVICCYPDLDGLAVKAAERARLKVGLVHPHDRWWMRWGVAILNVVARPFGCPSFFVHRTSRIEAILRGAGLERDWAGGTLIWRVAVYTRVSGASV